MNSSQKDPFHQSGSFEGASGSFNQQSGSGKNFDPLGLASNPKNDFLSPSFASSKPKPQDSKSLFAPQAVQQETKLTSLANLPPPIVTKAPIKVGGFDDGWDDADWNFDDMDKKEEIVPDFDINDK